MDTAFKLSFYYTTFSIQSYPNWTGVAAGFYSTQLGGKPYSRLTSQMIKQVESCVAPVCLEARAVATQSFEEKIKDTSLR